MKTKLPLIALIIAVAACNKIGKPLNFDYGHVKQGKYVNEFFNMELTLPDNWIIQSKEQMESTNKAGQDLVAGDNERMKAQMKVSEINTANLLIASQYEHGAAVDFNPSIILVAENVMASPGIKTGKDYLFHSRKLLEQSQLKYDHIDSEFARDVINGTEFYKMGAEINYGPITIRQVYYTAIVNGFSFNAIISYSSDEQREALLKAIRSMKFK